MGRTRLIYGGRQNNKTKQLIDFRGYPSPQLELELSWQVGAKVDQYLVYFRTNSFQNHNNKKNRWASRLSIDLYTNNMYQILVNSAISVEGNENWQKK